MELESMALVHNKVLPRTCRADPLSCGRASVILSTETQALSIDYQVANVNLGTCGQFVLTMCMTYFRTDEAFFESCSLHEVGAIQPREIKRPKIEE
jgi:hypothetical protein